MSEDDHQERPNYRVSYTFSVGDLCRDSRQYYFYAPNDVTARAIADRHLCDEAEQGKRQFAFCCVEAGSNLERI